MLGLSGNKEAKIRPVFGTSVNPSSRGLSNEVEYEGKEKKRLGLCSGDEGRKMVGAVVKSSDGGKVYSIQRLDEARLQNDN